MPKFRKTNLRRLPRIRFLKLGRQRVYGFAHHPHFGCPVNCPDCPAEPAIDIDSRTTGQKRLEIILHEAAHLAAVGLDEEMVKRIARYQALVCHHLGYRADEQEQTDL